MKLSLPIKLGIGVVALFTLVIATCLLWTPVKIRYYSSQFQSDEIKTRLRGLEGLIDAGDRGRNVIIKNFPDGETAAHFLLKNWKKVCNAPANDPEPPLHFAVLNGYSEVVRLFIARGADLNEERDISWLGEKLAIANYEACPLTLAAMFHKIKIAEILINNGAKTNSEDMTHAPLIGAATHGSIEMVKLLAGCEADINSDGLGLRAINEAVNCNNLDIAIFLINRGVVIDPKSGGSSYAFFIAVIYENKDLIKLLIEQGVDINIPDGAGKTPLDHTHPCGEIRDFLISHGAKTGEEIRKRTTNQVRIQK